MFLSLFSHLQNLVITGISKHHEDQISEVLGTYRARCLVHDRHVTHIRFFLPLSPPTLSPTWRFSLKSLSSSTPPEMSAKATALPWRMFCSSGADLTDCQIAGDSMVQLVFLRRLGESHVDVIYLFFWMWFVECGPKANQLKSTLEPQHG